MAEGNSCPWSEIEKIHNKLLQELINGHVGHKERAKTYVRWKMGFRNHCDDTSEEDGDVMGNFDYLEAKHKLFPGKYDVLKEIFAEDRKALTKIEIAAEKIETIKSTLKSLNRGGKDAENMKLKQNRIA